MRFLRFWAISRLRIVIGKWEPLNQYVVYQCRWSQDMQGVHDMHARGSDSTIYFWGPALWAIWVCILSIFSVNHRYSIMTSQFANRWYAFAQEPQGDVWMWSKEWLVVYWSSFGLLWGPPPPPFLFCCCFVCCCCVVSFIHHCWFFLLERRTGQDQDKEDKIKIKIKKVNIWTTFGNKKEANIPSQGISPQYGDPRGGWVRQILYKYFYDQETPRNATPYHAIRFRIYRTFQLAIHRKICQMTHFEPNDGFG